MFINKVVFGLLVAAMAVRMITRPADTTFATLSPLIVACVFLYGFTLSLFGDRDAALARQFLLSGAVLFLIYPVLWYGIDLDGMAKVGGVILTLFTALFFVSVITSQTSSIGSAILGFFIRNNLGFFAEREFSDSPFRSFQVGTVPFLLLPLALFADSFLAHRRARDLLAFLGIVAVVAISGARGLMLVSLAVLAFIVWMRARTLSRMTLLIIALPLSAYGLSLLASGTSVFSASEFSNSVKLGHARSFVENMDAWNVLFGDGLAAYYFSSGRGYQVAHTEITLLDLLRYFGFLVTPIFYAALVFPSMRIGRLRAGGLLASAVFFAFLVLSLTNPVLLNSSGLLIVVWYWQKMLRPASSTPVAIGR